MAVVKQTIDVGSLSTSALTIYTSPAGAASYSTIESLSVHAAGGRDQIKVHIVRSGGSVTADNLIFDRAIADGETRNIPLVNQVLKDGDFISVYAVTGSRLNLIGTIKEVS